MVGLPSAAAARVFAFEEPCFVAGIYSEVMVRTWRNAGGHSQKRLQPVSLRATRSPSGDRSSRTLAGIVGGRGERPALITSVLSIHCSYAGLVADLLPETA